MKKYTWRDYWHSQAGLSLLWISQSYADIYPWWNRRRYKVGGKLAEMWYYIKCRLWHKYTTVTPRFLAPTWTDRDHLLLHVNFEVLMDYYENEHINSWTVAALEKEIARIDASQPVVDYNDEMSKAWCESALPAAREIEALYHWWTVERPAREAEADRRLHVWHELWSADREAYTKANPDWQKTDNPHLHRWSLPAEHVEPVEVVEAHRHLQELSDEVRDAEDDAMLKRLIDIRGFMWT